MIPSDAAIDGFWSWFLDVADTLANDLGNEALLEQLALQVARLGAISWGSHGLAHGLPAPAAYDRLP